MKKLLLPLVCGLVLPLCGTENFPENSYFTAEAVRTVDADGVRRSGSALLAELAKEMPAYAKSAQGDAVLLRRAELLQRGMSQLKRDLADATRPDAICHAAIETEELRGFRDYFREVTARQARKLLPVKVLNVTDFGARGDGKTDNVEAFRKALGRAMNFRGKYAVTLKIPNGVFYFAAPRQGVPFNTTFLVPPEKGGGMDGIRKTNGYLVIGNQKDLTLEGSGKTELLFECPSGTASCVKLGGCDNVTVKNLAIDYHMRPFTQGVIKEVDAKKLSVLLESDDPQCALPGMAHFHRGHTWSFTPDGAFQWHLGFFMMTRAEKVGDRSVRYFYGNQRDKYSPVPLAAGGDMVKKLKPGMKMVQVSRFHGGGLQLDFCRFCTIENVTVYASQAMAFLDTNGYATTFKKCRIARKPGRMISTNGDGFHLANQIFGCAVVDCEGEYLYDDGLNTYARHGLVERQRPSKSYSVSDWAPMPESLVGLIDQKTGKVKALARCHGSFAKGYTFTPELPIVTREMIKNGQGRGLDLADSLLCINRTGEGFVALNTRFAHNHGKGIVIQSPHAMVENCTSVDPQQSGCHVGSLGNWGEYSRPHNVIVRNCTFEGGKHNFMAFAMIPGNVMAKCDSLADLLLENNAFRNCRSGQPLLLHNTVNLVQK